MNVNTDSDQGVEIMGENNLLPCGKNPLIDDATARGTLSNCADVLQVLQAVDLESGPSSFGVYLVIETVESAIRHAQKTLETETAGADR